MYDGRIEGIADLGDQIWEVPNNIIYILGLVQSKTYVVRFMEVDEAFAGDESRPEI